MSPIAKRKYEESRSQDNEGYGLLILQEYFRKIEVIEFCIPSTSNFICPKLWPIIQILEIKEKTVRKEMKKKERFIVVQNVFSAMLVRF